MNFMHDIENHTPALRPDGSIDREHYERKARHERSLALGKLKRDAQNFAARILGVHRTQAPARVIRQGEGFREA